MIHIAIVEDVKAEADLLQGCLEQYRQDNHIVFQLHFFPDADTFLQTDTHTFDIVFMDVDMPGRNGIEASRVLRETNKTIVLLFVTNLAQYAIAGYEVDALDYILKPINYYSFKLKIQKALEAVHHLHGIMLTISGEHGPQYVRSTDVLYIEVQNHSLIYHTQYSDLTATGTLKRVENQLAEEGFFRCNYCYLVNLRHVDFLDGNTVMVGGHPLQISRNRRKDFLQQMILRQRRAITMIAYLFRCLFFLMILFTGLLYTSNFPKRSHYLPRVIATTAFGILVSSFWAALFGGSPQPLLLYLLYQAAGFLGQFLIALFCVYLCVQMHLWTCLYMGTLFWFTQQASCSLTCILTGENSSTYQGIATSIGTWLAVALLLYGLLIRKVDASVLERIHSRTVFPNWVLMLLACLLLNSYASYGGSTGGAYYFALLLIDTVVLFYQYSIYRTLGLERENEAIHLLLEQSGKQYQISKQNMEQVNIKCHDLRHQIRVFRSEGRIDESVLKDMQKAVDAYDTIIRTGNPALDVLLTEKSQMCRSKQIGFTCMADGRGLLHMEPADLYALFGNALENAVEATEQLSNPDQKQIALTVRSTEGFCSVHLQNYTKEPLRLENGLPVTGKSDKANHGFGIRSMQLLAEKYGGELTFRQEGDVVNTYMLLPLAPAET